MGTSGVARVLRVGRNVADHTGLSSQPRAIADPDMPDDSGLPRDHRVIADGCAPGDSHLRHDERVLTNRDIMGNVNQVVNFRSRADDGIRGGAL